MFAFRLMHKCAGRSNVSIANGSVVIQIAGSASDAASEGTRSLALQHLRSLNITITTLS